MARMARLIVPGFPHHIVQRGARGSPIFHDRDDRRVYRRLLKEKANLNCVDLVCYCWMTTHIHLIAVPEKEHSIGSLMRDTHGPYALYFNRKYGFSGHVWQARFFSCVMDDDHFWCAVRYVERNPVRAGLVGRAEDYPWSSAAAHCERLEDSLLAPLQLQRDIPDWAAWLASAPSPSDVRRIRANTVTGRPLGSEAFIDQLETRLGVRLKPRKRGRKPGRKK